MSAGSIGYLATPTPIGHSRLGSEAVLDPSKETDNGAVVEAMDSVPKKKKWWSWKLEAPVPDQANAGDSEKGGRKKQERKFVLLGPFYAGCGAAMATCLYLFFLGVLAAFADVYFCRFYGCGCFDSPRRVHARRRCHALRLVYYPANHFLCLYR